MSKKSIIIILIIAIIMMFSGNIYLNKLKKDIYTDNINLFKYFEDNNLLDIDSNVNLTAIQKIHKDKKDLVLEMLNKENVKIEDANKLIEEKSEFNENLNNEIEELNNKINLLNTQVNETKNQYNKLKRGGVRIS